MIVLIQKRVKPNVGHRIITIINNNNLLQNANPK